MNRIVGVVILLISFIAPSQLVAQENNFWVFLSDKDASLSMKSNPLSYLSQASIDRRNRQAIRLDDKDLPVSLDYINGLRLIEGLEILQTSKWLNAVAVRCQLEQVDMLLQSKGVTRVAPVKKLKADAWNEDTQVKRASQARSHAKTNSLLIDYGLSANQIMDLNGQALHDAGYEGQGITIAILDSGFDNVDSMSTLSALRDEGRILSTRDFVDGDTEVFDNNSHGRYVLGCIAGIKEGEAYGTATQASFHLLRTENTASETTLEEFNWIAAAEYADSAGADVLNTSLGYTTFDDSADDYTYADMDGNTAFITIGADIAASRGMLVINSAGNSGSSAFRFIGAPADGDSVLAVGSVDVDSTHSSFSSFGPSFDGRIKPNVCAQGRAAVSINSDDVVVTINGTSFSSPILAGLAACLWQSQADATSMQVFDAIQQSAHLYDAPNDSLGYGIPDFGLAQEILAQSTSGLTSAQIGAALLIYPNPSVDGIQVLIPDRGQQGQVQVQVHDQAGRMVLSLREDARQGSLYIDTSTLSAGTYILTAYDIDGILLPQQQQFHITSR